MTLRPYQIEDKKKLQKYKAMGVFNEQRTGKTPTSLKVMQERGVKRLLIVCPGSAVYPWVTACKDWTEYEAVPIVGTKAQKITIASEWPEGRAYVICYDSLKATASRDGLVDALLAFNPDGIIADEAHRMKNRNTATAKAMFRTIKIPHRLALTGTPTTKEPSEIYSILHWLLPTKFPYYWPFIDKYFQTYLQRGFGGKSFKEVGGFKSPAAEKEIQTILNLISTQRKRIDVMPWLPQKDYQDVLLPLTKEQRKYLNDLENYYETEHIITQGTLDRLIRYRQICLDPGLVDLKGASPKTEWTLEYLVNYPETPCVIFSKFTSYIKKLRKILDENPKKYGGYGCIIGETSAKNRARAVDDFQNGRTRMLLVNIDAGKEALTLDRAESIIFTDQFPPASDIAQAEDRFVATTRARADKPHTIIRLMMEDSYDVQVYKLIERQASLTDLINDYNKYLKAKPQATAVIDNT